MKLNDPIDEEVREFLESKKVADLSKKHFSRFGEFILSFELSKYGWNVYSPAYDEYVDFVVIHKYICQNCRLLWNHTPALICKNCGKDFSKTLKKDIATGVCLTCGSLVKGSKPKCPNENCPNPNVERRPTCNNCKGEVEMRKHLCACGSTDYETKIRTIQVKSSRIEFDKNTGKSKNTYAVDMKPKDLIDDGYHFYIWCLIDNENKPHFLVLSVKDFIETMGESIKGISFFKDQDRQHFSAKLEGEGKFGKWGKFHNRFEKLE